MLILIGFGMEGVVEDVCEGWEKHNNLNYYHICHYVNTQSLHFAYKHILC